MKFTELKIYTDRICTQEYWKNRKEEIKHVEDYETNFFQNCSFFKTEKTQRLKTNYFSSNLGKDFQINLPPWWYIQRWRWTKNLWRCWKGTLSVQIRSKCAPILQTDFKYFSIFDFWYQNKVLETLEEIKEKISETLTHYSKKRHLEIPKDIKAMVWWLNKTWQK